MPNFVGLADVQLELENDSVRLNFFGKYTFLNFKLSQAVLFSLFLDSNSRGSTYFSQTVLINLSSAANFLTFNK